MFHIDEPRIAAIQYAGRRVFAVAGAVAILAVLGLIPDEIAELTIGVGLAVLLFSAVAPLHLLSPRASDRVGEHPAP